MLEFGEYCFIKWKFKFWNFLSENLKFNIFDRSKLWLDLSKWWRNNLGVSRWINCYSNPVRSIENSTQLIKMNFRSIESRKTRFSVEFSSGCLEILKRFLALRMVLWNIFTLHTCLLLKYNPMDINRGLCSQEILWSFSKIAICRTQHLGCIWGQICDNPLATIVWGGQKLSKDNIFVPSSYLFFVYFLC